MEGAVGKYVEERIRAICEWKGSEIEELNVLKDHVHLVAIVPPKVSISELMGVLKGKTAIGLFKSYKNLRKKPYWGNHFWSRGYCVTTLGLDEEKIRRYVKYQENNERLEEKEREEPGLF
jgi:putative transposase